MPRSRDIRRLTGYIYMGLLSWLGRLFGPRPAPAPMPTPHQPNPDTVESSLLDMFNSARKSAGLAPLTVDPQVHAAAEEHATLQASVNRMAHDGIGDGEPSDRLTDYGYRWSRCAENVAWGQSSPADVHAWWMASPPHRANILGPYRHVGIACASPVGGRHYWTADFATPE